MATYFGILDGSGNVYGVRVPDLPGVNGGGSTADDAVADVISAAHEWMAHHIAEGMTVPEPRTLDAIRAEIEEGETLIRIRLA